MNDNGSMNEITDALMVRYDCLCHCESRVGKTGLYMYLGNTSSYLEMIGEKYSE
ncbi:MAG: hypothetical protein PHW00_06425 [Clostridia bacterium]|nr:hypothetical protein [Clostridia bacterium]MDD3832267.1 hypothetical protein [Clostridia bacterium]